MLATDLAGAVEVLGRLAQKLGQPDKDGRVRIFFEKKYFGALQNLLAGTEWKGRYCWEFGNGWQDILAVDVTPLPEKRRCTTCDGKGYVEVKQ